MKIPEKILIVRTDRLGDVILSTPVIKNLRNVYPKAYISFMCRPYTRDALEGNPYLNEVIVYDKYGKDKSFLRTIKFASFLRNKSFDLAVVLHPTNRVNLLVFLAGIPQRIGFDKKLGWLLTKRFPYKKQEGKMHELDYTLDILRFLDILVVDKSTYFPVKESAKQKIINILSRLPLENNEKLIVIHPCASCPSKRWPIENFVKLQSLLRLNINFKFIVVGSKKEIKGDILAKEPGMIDLRGALSISELGALLKESDLLISNDSGPVHIAAALSVPVIAIFGRADPGLSPFRWKPLGDKSYYLHKDVGCRPCLAHNCEKEFFCLSEITPEEVAGLSRKILENIF